MTARRSATLPPRTAIVRLPARTWPRPWTLRAPLILSFPVGRSRQGQLAVLATTGATELRPGPVARMMASRQLRSQISLNVGVVTACAASLTSMLGGVPFGVPWA